MRKFLITIILALITVYVHSQFVSTKYFLKVRPIESEESASLSEKFDLKLIAQIPGMKITESFRENAQFDATFLVSAGGGVTIQRIGEKRGKNYSPYSFSPMTILLSGNTTKEGAILDVSWCSTIGLLNNHLQFGVGYDFGEVIDRSRWFGVMTIGINLTNN